MGIVIAVTGRKGGIGKTTITGNLAGEFAAVGWSVAVLDADPQQSLCQWAKLGQGLLSRVTVPVATDDPGQFQQAIVAARATAQLVLIDTPPAFTDPSLLAALLADMVLLPAGPSPLDIVPAKESLELVKEAQIQRGCELPLIRFVPSKLISRTLFSQDLPKALMELGALVLPGITQRVVVAEATLKGLTIAEYAKKSNPTRTEFRTLAKVLWDIFRDRQN